LVPQEEYVLLLENTFQAHFTDQLDDQKELLLKARFEHLNEQGGQRAVKKAIEKKRKKTASKEKKSRPFARGSAPGGGGGGGAGGGEGFKRRRVA
jgi:ribosomal RNA-processing protein 36